MKAPFPEPRPWRRFTAEKVREIRAMKGTRKVPWKVVAYREGCSVSLIKQIAYRLRYEAVV